ncbi:hypothetical protein KCP69_15480 [Salmonella enterica subsp. enterica]|nr:hypothetical protein KCP69_15480 [Salmonella enterica subsp. enterica]
MLACAFLCRGGSAAPPNREARYELPRSRHDGNSLDEISPIQKSGGDAPAAQPALRRVAAVHVVNSAKALPTLYWRWSE